MAEKIPKRLFIIKDLFSHGVQHAYFDTKNDRRLAIISFHNSIELFLRYALNTKSTSNNELDKMKFEEKIDEFKNKLLRNKELPYYPKIQDLNDIRNKIYHDYRIPTTEETEEFKVITRLFLEELTKEIFDLNFNDISLFDLETVRNPFVKDAYIEGLNQLQNGNNEGSMARFQRAFNEQWNSVYGTPSYDSLTRAEVHISNPKSDPVIDEIISSIDTLYMELGYSLKIIHEFIISKYHLELKDWVNTIYYGPGSFTNKRVTPEEINKMKRLLEEFIAETDDHILKDYLIERIKKYKWKGQEGKIT